MKENSTPDNKKKSFLRVWLVFPVLVGMVLAGVATGVAIKALTKPKAIESQPKKVVSRIMPAQLPNMPNPPDYQEADLSAPQTIAANEAVSPSASDESSVTPENGPPQEKIENNEVFNPSLTSINDTSMQAPEEPVKAPAVEAQDSDAPDAQMVAPVPVTDKNAPFTVQVGVFRYEVYANRKASQLKKLGYPSFIHEVMGKDQLPIYLVCFGRFQTRSEALPAVAAFKEKENMEAVAAFLKP